MVDLYLWLPKDFEEKYRAYIARSSQVEPTKENGEIKKFAHRLPSGTRWADFVIMFLSEERVRVMVRGIDVELEYEEMGFSDKRSGRPDSQWAFLRILSRSGGEISWADGDAKDDFKKTKERLTTKLEEFFRIDFDPFFPYADTKSYKIKLTLVPPPLVSKDEEMSLDSELQRFREEMTG